MSYQPSFASCTFIVSIKVDEIKSANSWRSILVHGIFEEVKRSDAKHLLHEYAEDVKSIISKKEHALPHAISDFSGKMHQEKIPIVYRIKILGVTGKQRNS